MFSTLAGNKYRQKNGVLLFLPDFTPKETPDISLSGWLRVTLYCHTWTLSLGPSALIYEVLLHLYAAHSWWATIKNTHTCLFRKLRNCQSDNITVNTESQGQRILLQTSDRIIWRYRSGDGYKKRHELWKKWKGRKTFQPSPLYFALAIFRHWVRIRGRGLPKWSLNILVRAVLSQSGDQRNNVMKTEGQPSDHTFVFTLRFRCLLWIFSACQM